MAVPERLLYIEVIVVSINPDLISWPFYSMWVALWRWSLMEVPLYCSKLGKLWCSCDQKKRIVVMLVLMLISVENPIVSSTIDKYR